MYGTGVSALPTGAFNVRFAGALQIEVCATALHSSMSSMPPPWKVQQAATRLIGHDPCKQVLSEIDIPQGKLHELAQGVRFKKIH